MTAAGAISHTDPQMTTAGEWKLPYTNLIQDNIDNPTDRFWSRGSGDAEQMETRSTNVHMCAEIRLKTVHPASTLPPFEESKA